MPDKDKTELSITIESDQIDWLTEIIQDYDLPDESKVLRVLLDYAIQDVDKDDIFAVFDDRNQVVDMWRDNGITCFQVAEGDF